MACADVVCREGDTVSFICDGGGACVEGATAECGLFVCRDGACLDTCGDNDDCLGEAFCAGGVCAADKGPGQPCTGRDECQSGSCVDGVCCDGPCTGQCEACDVAGSVGTCSPVSAGAAPRGGRQACAGIGVCAGSCNGVDRTECVFPAAGIECLGVACEGSTLTAASTCDGAGTCVPGQTTDCSPYVCADGACKTTCDDPDDCADGHCIDNDCCPAEDFVCKLGDYPAATRPRADRDLLPGYWRVLRVLQPHRSGQRTHRMLPTGQALQEPDEQPGR